MVLVDVERILTGRILFVGLPGFSSESSEEGDEGEVNK